MNNLLDRSYFQIFPLQIAALACFLANSIARADETWGGGSGQWDVGNTADWSGATWAEGYDPGTDTFTNPGSIADFTSSGGTVTVDDSQAGGSVGASYLYFSGDNGAYTLTGDPIYTDGSAGLIVYDNQTEAVTINNTLTIRGGNDQFFGNEGTNGLLTLNSTINYEGNRNSLFINNDGGGRTVVNGTVNAPGTVLYLGTNGGSAGIYEFGASSDLTSLGNGGSGTGSSLGVDGGTALLDADTFSSTSTFAINGSNGDASHGILTNGAFIGTQEITDERATAFLGGNAPVASGWAAGIYLDNGPTTITLSQVAGGRFTYYGGQGYANVGIDGNNGTYLITSGAGTVVLAGVSTYTGNNTLAADLNAARTLITNTSASAFGNNTGVVQVEANALLGGTGISTQQIVAMVSTSILTAGDPGDAGLGIAPSIGTLHLGGGLQALNGLTLDFKLDDVDGLGNTAGIDSDLILIGNLTLGGTVTVNFTNLGSVATGQVYTLLFASGSNVLEPGTTFDVNAPTGYALDDSYNGTGYKFNTRTGTFSAEFMAVPEPSTYAMLFGGLGLLVLISRFRGKLTA
jgi:hypothetical protein